MIRAPKKHGYSSPGYKQREADMQPQNHRNPTHQVKNHTASTQTLRTEQQANYLGK